MSWYEVISEDDISLNQGDIISGVDILVPYYESDGSISAEKLNGVDIIVITQSCDIVSKGIDKIMVCPIIGENTLKKMIATKDDDRMSLNKMKEIRSDKRNDMFMLNKFESTDSELCRSITVVDYKNIYPLPKFFLEKHIKERNKKRLRLLSPYNEKMSNKLGLYFSRIGLPIDIEQQDIATVYKNIDD